ncbi:MAG: preprotein translocase, YajC subunit [Actinobacteria bacterium]|jgi:preprotein translocase subunit YajC|nr:preprotein translocase, YajC subunit [Actinomycetota bacterium]MCW3044689.1 preprotein translocase, YajC subunit [Actinomycetota bacterium]MEA2533408.1 preprotein translocase subunit YajC [Actinomycetota bacterium]
MHVALHLAAAQLQAAAKSSGSPLSLLVPLLLLGGFFYIFMIRPQKRKLRQHEDLVSTLVPGDEVVTIGGIVGYVKSIHDDFINLEISDGCVIRVLRQAIGRKVEVPDLDTTSDSAGLEGTAGTDDTE